MFIIMSGNCAGAKRSNRKLWNKLLSPPEGSVELKQGGDQANDNLSEEADVTTEECGLCKA